MVTMTTGLSGCVMGVQSGAEGQGCSSEDSPQVTMNYARFINAVSLARQPSPIRLASK